MPPEIALLRWTEKNIASTPDQDDLDVPGEVGHASTETPEEHPEPLRKDTPEYEAKTSHLSQTDDRPPTETPNLAPERHTDDPLAELRSLHPHLLTPEQKELLWSESATPEPCRHYLGEPAEHCGSTPSRLYQKGRRCFTHAPDPIATPGTPAR